MGSDLFALKTLADELNEKLAGARVDKIQQPETDELRINLRGAGKNYCLRISCNAGAPGINITDSKKQSPQTAPAFCMLLRKHLSAASIEEIGIFNNDRTVFVKFIARTEMRDTARFYIFAEIMNRYSNVVFTDEELIILDAVKKLGLDNAGGHIVLRGMKYEPVKQDKVSFLSDCAYVFKEFKGGDLHKFVCDRISGFSGLTVAEFLRAAKIPEISPQLTDDELARIDKTLTLFRDIRKTELYSPCVADKKEVYPFPYSNARSEAVLYPSISEAYDALNTENDAQVRHKARLKNLNASVKRLIKRTEKNIAIDADRLTECADMEKYRIYGELIVTNIYKIKKGDDKLICEDYYNGSTAEIPLDERLSPAKNSAAYFNKYSKLKRAKEFTEKKFASDRATLDYLRSIEKELSDLPLNASSAQIEEELQALGGVKKQNPKSKVRKEKSEPPLRFRIEDFTVYSGKNNLQNDELTLKTANSSDIWMHLKNRHGRHTIIKAEGRAVPDSVLKAAAEITAATESAPVEVDYTERRNVKRMPDGHPGQVVYVNFKTIIATPDEHNESAF